LVFILGACSARKITSYPIDYKAQNFDFALASFRIKAFVNPTRVAPAGKSGQKL